MKKILPLILLGLLCARAALSATAPAAAFTRTEDVVYGRKFGTALTLDVFRPEKPNGGAILFMVSGGWVSNHASISANGATYQPFLSRGYTVFAICHGSQPRFTIPEIAEDIFRAARFIRFNAAKFGVDPQRFGVTGTSSGGHLSLILGLKGGPGKSDAKDPIDRESAAVQAVACFCPPTDFNNWTRAGDNEVLPADWVTKYKPAWGPQGETAEGRYAFSQEWSPIQFVSAKMPPTLVIHGDSDKTVPIYQAEAFAAAAKAAGGIEKLVVRPGKDHNWPEMGADREQFADWFDQYLKAPTTSVR
jgi:acetyl esterase/lipase